LAAYIVRGSIAEALKGLKVALKSEFTTATGKLNFVSMILLVFVMVVFNLHEMVANALSVDGHAPVQNHVMGPALLVSLFFIGSLICVMIVELKK
jgi:hypothetical protein